ncbi:MAG TPA: protein-disulfide reductase DsbD domain-containing protein [Rhizomicrobium sp.]|nr:protein-disulfide reductase DsbD domain-containing protein [Rhizomicrobium sp.]
MHRLNKALLVVLIACGAALPAAAQIDSAPKVHARLIAEENTIVPGQTVAVALEQNIRAGWHTYWRNPGDAGEPTEIVWKLPPGWHAGPIAWPYPKELPVGPLMDYGYEGRPWLLVDITAPADAKPGTNATLNAAVSWLVCKEVCIPENATLTLPLSIGASPAKPDPKLEAQYAAARELLPVASPWPVHFRLDRRLDLFVAAPKLAEAHPTAVHFFPFGEGPVKGIAPQQWQISPQGLSLRLAPGKQAAALRALNGVLVLQAAGTPTQALTISATPGPVPDFVAQSGLTLPLAVLFALLGGVILNLMPCVLPILAMKALAIAGKSGRAHEAAGEGLAYGLGAVLSFAVLGAAVVGLRAGGQALGWGFQLQQPVTVAAFALLVFAVGLNLSGVFEVPGLGAGEALARRGGHVGAFFTGVLAVAVAAPCTAPFMAAALGFALTQPVAVALLVFVALGIGFAAPFVAIGFSPALLRLLPKPGAWMATFRQVLAFPMYGTALWLAWVLSFQTSASGLIVLLGAALLLAFALWLVGAIQQSGRGASVWLAWGVTALAIVALAALVPMVGAGSSAGARTATAAIPSQSYSDARLAALRGEKRGVFVDATAAWCVTCLVNEKVALDDVRVRNTFAGRRIAFLIADWTNRNPQVTALLQAHARSGVPLYLYYAPGAADAVVLPQILTPDTILGAVAH